MKLPYKYAPYAAILILLVIFIGFWPRFFSSMGSAPLAFHVHGITSTAWVILAGIQSFIIHKGNVKWHRTIGRLSLILFPFLAAGFVMIINVSAAGYLNEEDVYYDLLGPSFAYALGLALIAYLYFFYQALRHRRNIQLHSANMLATLFLIWEAPASRVITRFIPGMGIKGPEDYYKIPYAISLGMVMALVFALFLYLRKPSLRRPFLIAVIFIALQILGFMVLPQPDSRSALFTLYAEISPNLTTAIGFLLAVIVTWAGWKYPKHKARG